MAPQITILITTLNRRDLLEKTLWHIYETSSDDERNIWIWDNASTDDTPDFLGTMVGWPGVRVFRSKTNVGLVNSKSRMLKAVETPYIFSLDDDIWLLNQGWVRGVVRALDGDSSIIQIGFGSAYHETNNYGIAHTKLDRPFFRVPPYLPGPKGGTEGAVPPAGSKIIDVNGETVIVPTGETMPFPISGSASAWRVSDLRSISHDEVASTAEDVLVGNVTGNSLADLTTTWGMPLMKRGGRQATIVGYGMLHPCPGPLWHLGRYEKYWETRCILAQQYYGRPGDEQRRWLEVTREALGWGRALEDPEVALPLVPA